MSNKKKAFVHIGKHKTGSTSIQAYLYEHRQFLLDKNIRVVTNDVVSDAHPKVAAPPNLSSLAHLYLRDDLMTPVRYRNKALELEPGELEILTERLNKIFCNYPEETLVLSAEAFSFYREVSEIEGLKKILEGIDIIPVFYTRDRQSWLNSWKIQLIPLRQEFGIQDSIIGTGIFDFSPDSWLLDDTAILDLYGNKTVQLSYEECVKHSTSVIPSFLTTLGLIPNECPSWKDVWKNSSATKKQSL